MSRLTLKHPMAFFYSGTVSLFSLSSLIVSRKTVVIPFVDKRV